MVRYILVFVYIFILFGVANAQTDSGKGSKRQVIPDTLHRQISQDTTHTMLQLLTMLKYFTTMVITMPALRF